MPSRLVILLDPQLRPALGGVGQIGILGEGLASGYLRLPQETKTRFIKTPEAIREVLPQCGPITYLTGDVGRYQNQDDILEFVGRLDSQVKLRGQRVELGEIEAALLSAKAVTEAVALVHGDRLIGYFSTLQGVEEGDAVAQCMEKTRQRLPRYMWPELVHVKEWPRGRTGKVDRKALPVPTICVQDAVPPRSSLEKKILEIFCQALRRDPTLTSVHSDFFTLGGTSLKAAALLSALRAQVPEAVALQFDELYAHPDVASLAQVLSGSRQEILLGPAPVEGLLPASLGQEHMLVLQELHEGSSAYNSPLILKLEGALNRSALSTALDRVIARHDVLRSNLLRDTIDGEPAVVQVTTPAAEFQCDMEFWDIPDDTAQQPQRRRLRHTLGSRHVGAAGRFAFAPGAEQRARSRSASSFQLSSWLGIGTDRPGSGLGTPERAASWRNLFQRGRARRPSWSPIFYQGYNSPPMRSPEGNREDRMYRLTEMTSTSSLSLGDLGRAQQWSPGCSELVLSWLVEEAHKPFNLRDEPLIRIVLAKVGSEQHFLLVSMHHSVTDGRSLSILRQELTAFYNQITLKLAEGPKLPALSMQYADFAYCQRRWMAQGRLERELAYWRSQLQQLSAVQLLTDFPRPPNLALDGGQVTFQLQPALANRLRSLARAKSVTLFALLLGLFALALSRWAAAQDLAIASPVGHRQGNAVEPLIGYFVNTVLFRVNLKNPCTFEDLLQRLRDTVVGAFQNSSAPYAKVLEAAELDPAAVPAMFVLQDRDETAWSMEGLRVEQVEIKRHAALFDVTCEMQEMPGSAGGLQGVLVYNKHLWTNSRAVRFAESLQTLALAVAEQPAVDLLQLAVISSNDRAKVLEWGGHNRPVASPTPLIKALKVQLLQCQHDIAVLSGDRSVTYGEFGARVMALSLALRARLPEALESLVALLLPRSVDLAVAIWAVLSAGAAYVPIDPDYPPQRIAHILKSAGPQLALALAREEHAELVEDMCRVFGTWQWPSPETSFARVEELTQAPPQGLAYVIYTSGSTGKPKGVAIEHRSAANMVQEQLSLMRITREDRVLQFFKPAFDGAVQEYLSTFLAGAVLVLWGEDKEETFAEVLSRHHCTACTLTPSALSVLDPKRLPLLTKLAVAAEACPPTLVELWACQRRLLNAYGPSENTVVATSAELGASESSNDFILRSDSFDSLMSAPSRQHVPIGTPLGGVQCYVFEASAVKSLQAIGTPGELCLGGIQLARGYFGDAAKTAEKFVINPLGCQKMQRMYKTGDVVTWLPQGQLLYLGRNDEMVKVRGFRIELSEVEAALAALGAQAVAVAVNPAKDGLWAWVTPETLSSATLRSELLRALPQYMVPTRIAVLEKFPLTPNGKIDKARLLAENCSEAHMEGPIVGPQSPLEHRLCATAAMVLGLETLGVTADLRSVGMTSLKAVLLSQKLRDAGLTIPLSKLYELQTVRALAEHLAMQEETVLGPVSIEADVESGGRCDLCLSASQKGCSGFFQSVAVLCWRLLAWVWISGVVIWPAMLPLKLASRLARSSGAAWSLCFLVLLGYPLYLLLMILLVICTKWLLIGRYRAGACPVNSWAFLRWWAVDRLLVFVNELCLGAFRGGPVYFAYLRSLGLQAAGYCRIDTRHVSESLPEHAMFDLISLGRCCVVAEGAKLRPAAAEAAELQLRPLAFGDYCAVGENAVCTAGCAVGDHVTLQPLSMLSGRTGRTLPDGSVWKGALLVQSRQQPIRVPAGFLCHDLLGDVFALLLTLFLQTGCSLVAYCTFGLLAEAQGFGVGRAWRWQAEPEGYLFAATWLLFGPPVMASADVLLDLDLAGLADQVTASMGLNRWEFGLRLAGMVVVSFAVYGWSLTLSSAFLCRYIRGSRNLNSWFFQVRRVVLRLTFPRYPGQLAGTWAMSLYLRLLGGRVAVSEPPLEPRKLHVGEGALLLTHQALGECEVGQGSVVGAGAVLLPHSQVEAGAVVGAMSVAGRPVRSDLQLVGNPGVIMRRATLEQEPMPGWGRHFLRRSVQCLYPLVAPMLLQMLLLTTLLPAMYVLTLLLDMLVRSQHGAGLVLAVALPAAYVALGWCLCLLAVLVHRLLSGSVNGSWCAFGSVRHFLATFSEQLNSMSIAIFMGMAFGSPFYNFWLKAMGGNVASDALLLTAVAGDYRALTIGRGASVDKEAVLSCRRLLPGPKGAGFYICQSRVVIGPGSSVSHSAAVVAGETGRLSTLAPLSAVAPSTRLPAQTFAVGLPPQAFPWSKASLVKPSTRPLPRELRPPILLPIFVSRAIGRMKVLQGQQAGEFAPLVTGSTGFLGRSIVAALLESRACSRVFCLVRAADPAAAQHRVIEAAKKAGATHLHLLEAVPGDLQQRNFGRPLADVQRLAGRVTHVLHAAAKVNLTEPFELMKKDNVDATAHLLEFCCISKPKPFHHISTMGILTPEMLDRHGSVRESATLGDIRALPLYGTGDQANGYPQSKWLAEVLVLEAARQGLPCYIHRPGLIGGHSVTGAAAEDVFFHFLADVLKLRRLPQMNGRKFNVTPVDWVAKAIARIALPGFLEEGKLPSGSVFHPAAPNNAITTNMLAAVLKRFGYGHLAFMDFVRARLCVRHLPWVEGSLVTSVGCHL
eukprot:s5334_g1.t5